MRILWAEEMAKVVNGSYESYIDDYDLKRIVRIYPPDGIYNYELKLLKKIMPKNYMFIGMFYCDVERKVFLLISEK